ncbi:MAG: Fe-S cluster assembly protein SufD [Actinomycetes bacterium]
MSLLTPDATSDLGGPGWFVERRATARSSFDALGMPDAREEVWRYSPIGDLNLAAYSRSLPSGVPMAPLLEGLDSLECTRITVSGGVPRALPATPAGVSISSVSSHGEGEGILGSVAQDDEAIVAFNTANLPDALVIDVSRGAMVATPILVIHEIGEGATFSRTIIRMAEGSSATVIEVSCGGNDGALNVPVAEIAVGDGANLRYGSIQVLDRSAWHLATIQATVGRDANIAQFTAGIGAAYDRCRTDAVLAGQGASSILRSTYLGEGDQVHDLRTKQDHAAPKTISDLLCKGAVTGSSRSVYTGLIKMQNGAVRSNATQTNHNLVLSKEAHADSVPNLDIAENDVRCSHASTVGPIDEDQRYYLESRGINPNEAERLLVRGFFADLLDKTALPGATDFVAAVLNERFEGLEIS